MIPQTETEISQAHVVKTVEAMLRVLLEKAQHASEIISGLRSENQTLSRRVEELEQNLAQLQRELSAREMELQQKEAKGKQVLADSFLTPEEKAVMRQELKDLLARISQYV
jgi:predicted RNase H-like nuclease (RuvC/YqgF family)